MRRLLRPVLAFVCIGLVGCEGAEEPPLYEDDDPFADNEKGDGFELVPFHRVEGYAPTREGFVIDTAIDDTPLQPGTRIIAIRSLTFDNEPSVVFVDADTLATGLVTRDALATSATATDLTTLGDSPFLGGLNQTESRALQALNPGSLTPNVERFALTVDMCQSSRTWEADLFRWLVELTPLLDEPAKVGIAMTGLWAHRHPKDFRQLIQWQNEGALDITWINHSFRHQLSKDSSGQFHFLTASDIDFDKAVLDLEILLLEQGQVFSVLFRYPGLVHNSQRLGELNELSLFALDADGWIAKGEPIHDGAVVLLHGNGNEAVGIRGFMKQIEPRQQAIEAGSVELVNPVHAAPVLPAP